MRSTAILPSGGLLEAVSCCFVGDGFPKEIFRMAQRKPDTSQCIDSLESLDHPVLPLVWANPVPDQESWISTQFLPSWSFLPGLGQPKA